MASTSRHLVVDGSNIATESRTLPSLAQLDEAVRAVIAEDPSRQVTVIVDATFSHRIDQSERKTLDDALDAGEIIMPPAGAVGRGDAFILQVAERANAAVLSNDSFQEFHGEHEWLFEEGRLIGGKPVEGIGWIFVARVPVRGPASRRATRGVSKKRGASKRSESKRGESKRGDTSASKKRAAGPAPKPSKDNPPPTARKRGGKKNDAAPTEQASKAANQSDGKSGRKSGGSGKPKNVQELNSLSDFMLFVTQHSIGDEVTGIVESFSSHGCYLTVGSARCYLPSSAMGDPPPTRARDVVSLAQEIIVKVDSLDADRRGINVVLIRTLDNDTKTSAGDPRASEERKSVSGRQTVAGDSARETTSTRSNTTVATKKTAKKAAKKAPAKKAAKKTTAKKAAKKTAKKAPAKKATATATSSARVKRATARKAAKKAPAKKTAAKKTAKKAPAKKAPAKKAAKKTTAKKAPAKKTAAKKAPAKKTAAKKTAKKAPAKKAPAKKAAKKTTAKKATKKR